MVNLNQLSRTPEEVAVRRKTYLNSLAPRPRVAHYQLHELMDACNEWSHFYMDIHVSIHNHYRDRFSITFKERRVMEDFLLTFLLPFEEL